MDLQQVNVPVVHELEGVGKNLHNHVAFFVNYNINDTNSAPLNWATAMEYLLFRDGLMSGTGKDAWASFLPQLHLCMFQVSPK
jgi:choline dehydrogenase-like flavoprotein